VERGEIKAIWIMGTNPVVSLPDSEKTRRALRQCELVVVSDCMERTDTSAFADVLLPVTGWGEKDGTVTNSERRISRQRALRSAPGEARHDWQVICEVAGRLGFGSAFDYAGPADIFREHAALSGFENPSAGNPGSRAFDISGLSNISDREYQELSPIQWPVNADHPTGRARLFTDRTFYTSNGRAQFVAVSPQLPKSQPNKKYPFILNTGRIRDQWHTMTRTGLTPRLLNHIDSPV
ncbi:MAG: molybdopterin oxidoreductase family protein, partial [bacterium]